MFRCVECGCEYDIKPDYCDCGNDAFEEVKAAPPKPQQTSSSVSNHKSAANSIPSKSNIPQIKARPVQYEQAKTFEDQYPGISRLKKSLDPVSLTIFVLCIILSLCTVFFIGNPKEESVISTQTQTVQKPIENIPNVDSFWDNTPVSAPPVQQQVEQTPANAVQKEVIDPITAKFEEWLNKPQKPTASETVVQTKPVNVVQQPKPIAVKTVQPVQTKPQTVQKSVVQAQKSQTQNKTTVSANAKTNSPGAPNDLLTRVQQNIQFNNSSAQSKTNNSAQTKTSQVSAKPAAVQTTKTDPSSQVSKTSVSNTQTTTAQQTPPTLRNVVKQPVKTQAQLNQEVASYKASLRNNIGKKINFLNVVGDGNCAITFRVDSSGKLTNRSFSSQSSNITLNDAVYNAMMSTPSFNPPPEGYKNETMTLRVKIYDGNYEVTLN